MLYSQSIEESKRSLFLSLLAKVIQEDLRFKAFVDRVLLDAHELSLGRKDRYSINRANYQLVTHIVLKDPDFAKAIKPEDITKSDYQRIEEIVADESFPE